MSDSKERRGPADSRYGESFDNLKENNNFDNVREKKKWKGLIHIEDFHKIGNLHRLVSEYQDRQIVVLDKNIAPERMRMIKGFRGNLNKILSKRSFR